MQKKSLTYFWVLLFLGVALRLLGNLDMNWPNFSPLMALAVVGAVYLRSGWNIVLAPLILLSTELVFLPLNQASEGHAFSAWFLVSMAFYFLVSVLAILLTPYRSWLTFLTGSFLGSLGFYVLSNTYSWWQYQAQGTLPGYAHTWAGWWQANTVGLPGFIPSWFFLRNEFMGDAVFVTLLLAVLDRARLGLQARSPEKIPMPQA